jgi:hypothetical protein
VSHECPNAMGQWSRAARELIMAVGGNLQS